MRVVAAWRAAHGPGDAPVEVALLGVVEAGRGDQAGDAGDRGGAGEAPYHAVEPAGIHHHVVVGEGDQLAQGLAQPRLRAYDSPGRSSRTYRTRTSTPDRCRTSASVSRVDGALSTTSTSNGA